MQAICSIELWITSFNYNNIVLVIKSLRIFSRLEPTMNKHYSSAIHRLFKEYSSTRRVMKIDVKEEMGG